jgi:hypothetical protein
MEAPEIKAGPTKPGGAPFQYSLRTMLAVTAFLAVSCSLLFASPGWVRVAGALCLTLILPAMLTVLLVYGRGYVRTFCIGAVFPSGITLLSTAVILAYITFAIAFNTARIWQALGTLEDVGYSPAIFVGISWGLSVLVGLIGVGVRWSIEGPRRYQQREASLP